MPRAGAAVLAHVTSLPGASPVGDLGGSAQRFLDLCAETGLDGWQTLPVGPCGAGNSPYSALSSFAGNPLLIAPEPLVADGLLLADEIAAAPSTGDRVDYPSVARWKRGWLETAWRRFETRAEHLEAFGVWREAPEQRWLDDWGLFASLRGHLERRAWFDWPAGWRDRDPTALDDARRRFADALRFHGFVQFVFDAQWRRLRDDARARGVALIGDLPFYPAHDSADTWSAPDRFALDDRGRIARGAGVPPDYFSREGQLWGTPVLRWDRLGADGNGWWRDRLESQLGRFDVVRLDHFRGYAAFWSVDGAARSARDGRWETGPGAGIFSRIDDVDTRLIAEDLGDIDDAVHALRQRLGLPSMAVLPFLPSDQPLTEVLGALPARTVLYTATHDNDTTRGWIDSLEPGERHRLLERLECDEGSAVRRIVERCLHAPVETVVLPLQDWLELPGSARMNTPGVARGNWEWRAVAEPTADQRAFLSNGLLAADRGRGRRLSSDAGPGD